MKRRSGLILVAVFIGLVIILLLQSVSQPADTPESIATQAAQQAQDTLANFNLLGQRLAFSDTDLVAVRVRSPLSGQSFTMTRDTVGNWLAAEGQPPLDSQTADSTARTVVLLPHQRDEIAIGPETNLANYGFNPQGQIAVEVVLVNGRSHAVAIGALSPSQLAYYAIVDSLPTVLVVERGAVDFLLVILRDFGLPGGP